MALCVPLQLDAQTNLIDGTYMRNWLILGPFFPQDLDKDFLEKYGGETNVRPEPGDVVQTKDGRELIWKSYESPSFRVNFITAVGRFDAATIYAFSYIKSKSNDNTRMLITKDDGIATWINGSKVYLNPRVSPPNLDVENFEVNLNAGLNPCLVKVFNGFGDWAFAMKGYPSTRAEITGVVTNETGEFSNEANIRITNDQGNTVQVNTDEYGRYFASIFPVSGTYRISAEDSKMASGSNILSLLPESRITQHIRIKNLVSIKGQVLMLDGETTHKNLIVQLTDEKTPNIEPSSIVASGVTDRLGQFQFINIPMGKYFIRCHTITGLVYLRDLNSASEIVTIESKFDQIEFICSVPNFKRGLWKQIGPLEGLVGTVNHIFRDQEDNLWFGTSEGLAKHDGKEFSYLTVNDGLAGNNISYITQTKDKNLWIGTNEGLSIFNGKEFKNFSVSNGLLNNKIRNIMPNPDSSVWFTMGDYARNDGGLGHYNGQKFTFITQENGLSLNSLSALHVDQEGEIWLGTIGEGFANLKNGNFTTYSGPNNYPNMFVYQIFRDSRKNLWLHGSSYGSAISLSKFDGHDFIHYGNKEGLSSPLGIYFPALLDSNDMIWIGHNDGAYRFDGNSFVLYTEDDGLSSNDVKSIMKDKDGSIWFGTPNGVSRYVEDSFINFTQKDGLPSTEINTILAMPDGSIWFDKTLYSDGNFSELKGVPGNSVSHRNIDGGVWFLGGGVTLYRNENYLNIREEQGLVTSHVNDLIQTYDGTVWMGTANGISKYDGETIRNYGTRDGLTNGPILAVLESSDGSLWFGGEKQSFGDDEGELFHYDEPNVKKFTEKDGLIKGRINSLYESNDKKLYIGTTKGLSIFDGKEFVNISVESGLRCRYVNDIYQDEKDTFWFAGQGISIFDGIVWSYIDTRDGLAGDVINAIHQDESGYFWFATNKGLTKFSRIASKPTIYIESITVDKRYTNFSEKLQLLSGQRATFELGTTDFDTVPEKKQYRYKIPEINENWSQTINLNTFDYTFNEVGSYTVEVQYIDRDLNYSDIFSVKLDVARPWFLNTFVTFPIGFAVFSLIGFASFQALKIVEQRREIREYQQLAVEELEEAQDIQMGLMPQSNPEIVGFNITGKCVTASEVGGDFFDYIQIGPHELGLAVADVSGKQMQGAMNAVMTNGILQVSAQELATNNPSDIMAKMNNILKSRMKNDTNVTMIFGILNSEKNTFSFCNAGHHAHPILCRNRKVTRIKSTGFPLGMKVNITYPLFTVQLESGDSLILMSDGIIESMNEDGVMYSETDKMEKLLQTVTDETSVVEIRDQLINDAIQHGGHENLKGDDITVLVVQMK